MGEVGWNPLISHQDALYLQKHFSVHINTLDTLKKEIDEMRPLPKDRLEKILQKMRLDWNYNSNAIEGNSLNRRETETFLIHGFTSKGKPFKDYEDIKGHNEVVRYLNEVIEEDYPLTNNLILDIHSMIIPEGTTTITEDNHGKKYTKPIGRGAYKTLPNHVFTETGEIHYYCEPHLTQIEMSTLIDWVREYEAKGIHPLIATAIFHHRFVAIHPFDDGNGRMSRALSNLILMRSGFPLIVIRADKKSEYYASLSNADAGDYTDFIELTYEYMKHACEIYIKGARGESIEEEEDIQKRVALLKKRLTGRAESIIERRTPQSIRQCWENSIHPALDEVRKRLQILDDFFIQSEWYSIEKKKINDELWGSFIRLVYEPSDDFFLPGELAENFSTQEIHSYYYWTVFTKRCLSFKLEHIAFSFDCNLVVGFDDFRYNLSWIILPANSLNHESSTSYPIKVTDIEPQISKKYDEHLTYDEIAHFSKSVVVTCLSLIEYAEANNCEPHFINAKSIENKLKPLLKNHKIFMDVAIKDYNSYSESDRKHRCLASFDLACDRGDLPEDINLVAEAKSLLNRVKGENVKMHLFNFDFIDYFVHIDDLPPF